MATEQKTRRWRTAPEETGPEQLDADMTLSDIIDILARLKFTTLGKHPSHQYDFPSPSTC
jgi:hypothetical protein